MSSGEIWVVCEMGTCGIATASLELVGEGARLARGQGYSLVALLYPADEVSTGSATEGIAGELSIRGVDRLIVFDGASSADDRLFAGMIATVASEARPEVLLMSATIRGRSVMPRVAARLRTGLTADCTGLNFDRDGLLVQTRPAYGENLLAEIVCPRTRPQMATVRPGVFPAAALLPARPIEIVRVKGAATDPGLVRLLFASAEASGAKSLVDARVVVAGGRGLGSAEGFRQLERLASLLGGVIGASRSAVEAGYAPYSKQIGQTGHTIRPEIYIACGISGSVQHLAGVSAAKHIIAINSDRRAPIFQHADYGIVGDLHAIVGTMIEILGSATGEVNPGPSGQAGPGIP